jgi:hypothetical protein
VQSALRIRDCVSRDAGAPGQLGDGQPGICAGPSQRFQYRPPCLLPNIEGYFPLFSARRQATEHVEAMQRA